MPKLLLFAPCQKAIVDKNDNSISLISILHGITIDAQNTPSGVSFPENAVIPFPWAMVAIWLQSSDDRDKVFEQRIEVIAPNDKRTASHTFSFQMTHRTRQVVMLSTGFPIGMSGEYRLLLCLREAVEGGEWKEISEYPVTVNYKEGEKRAD